ncbi:zinc transporter permease subunit ZevB [Rodentibacter pneumotropicus]|uniref:Nickel/cobalt efflux system n=1 Tax=Rodentibacter pneumotropicus TaxID=758 RepID=A0A3S4VDS3_9PAST|nr:zinc transporter permease subunit ZevB [Rodentibacter pneumotropicus]NBH75764.1 nickel/cobalt transporter [Rodentibacter pneumotropicus]OOF61028.1 cobalt transporter [Rodentibacter pneumotropicus]THA02084.1 nickel/cobalt transporter [Rodentibacter pneumotropicus]THA06576.1 nickel/cobalt transporter [Rodentibacter pneumotropicus]THA13544.1 nickel/cobalt transporter [Rodentibacter pneumotropicus]
MKPIFPFKWLIAFFVALIGIFWFFPWLFAKTVAWQQLFNQLISENLHAIQHHSVSSGMLLITVSFLYGVLHAVGPGHGKFIIASYLSTHESELKQSVKLSLLSSLMQGIVAITATSIVVVILNLSSRYFKLSQLWLERSALILLMGLGCYWIYQGIRKPPVFRIKSIQPTHLPLQSAAKINRTFKMDCPCGHQHLPNAVQLKGAKTWKSQFLVIMSIGLRPCTGAIFVLFLAYMMELFIWGIFATLAMSIGTGLMLSLFAVLVRYAKRMAIQLGQWYGARALNRYSGQIVKIVAGIMMIFFALALFYGTTLEVSGGAVLFGK